MKKWIAFFSYTGTDIYNVSKQLGRFPDMVVTNNSPEHVNKLLTDSVTITYVKSAPTSDDYRRIIGPANSMVASDTVITLHGWMRIVPDDICEGYDIYNLHPGLITKYPELKGKDPQLRAFTATEHDYAEVGIVIHKVTSELDGGKVVVEKSVPNLFPSFKELNTYLHRLGTKGWLQILPDVLGE